MKASVAFLVIFLAFVVEAANKKHKAKHVRNEHEESEAIDEGDLEWPQPEAVRKFEVPEGFTANPPSEYEGATYSSGRQHHGKLNHKTLTTYHQ